MSDGPPGSNAASTPATVELSTDHEEEHFSFSQLNMFMRCPRQYRYRYGDGLKRPPSLIMASGTSIHSALEYNNNWHLDTGENANMETLLDITSDEHDKSMTEVEDESPEKKAENKDENIEAVRLHRRVMAPHITPQTAEQGFTLRVPSDLHGEYKPVIGYIDTTALVPDPRTGPTQGRPVKAIEDYKRVGKVKPQAEINQSIQLTLYDMVYDLAYGELPDVIGLRLLGFNGPRSKAQTGPGPYSLPMYRQQSMMTPDLRRGRHLRVLEQVRGVQRAIASGYDQPVDDFKVCNWCGYKDICQPEMP